jgi:hypothetical protein
MRGQYLGWKVSLGGFYVIASTAGLLLAFSGGPPLGVTGDFAQPNCTDCHSGNSLNAAGGTFTISGVPAEYAPGNTYPITVTIAKAGQSRWGFELATRVVTSGQQAGTLTATNTTNTQVRSSGGIQYISHTGPGTQAGSAQGTWTFNWTAPATAVGGIRFGAAGNAANNNLSNSGDFIYTTTVTINPVSAAEPITALFPQIAIGGGFSTVITLMNTGRDALNGNLVLTKSDGTPLDASLSSKSAASTAAAGTEPVLAASTSITIPPGGTRFIEAGPVNVADPTAAGWARVESAGGTVNGVASFQFTSGTQLASVAGVLSADETDVATIPVDDDASQGRFTGYAVANHGDSDANIRIIVVDANGIAVGQPIRPPQLNPLRAKKHVARFLFQDLNDPNLKFQGSMVLIADGGMKVAVVALVQNSGAAGNLYTAIPVIRSKAPGIN